MKRLITICAIMLILVAANANANTIASSTMVFQGTLTPSGNALIGTIAMIDENGTGLGDGVTGFDVYGKTNAWATYDVNGSGSQNYAAGQIGSDHDAYTTAGGWGTYYNPDCADWYNYQLRLTEDHWYLEYNGNVGYDGILTGASAPPMSGAMNWITLFASEDDTGAYYGGMGTPETAGYAATFAASKGQSTAPAWDMDWSWGSDYVPLELPGFDVDIALEESTYTVTLTPIPEPATVALLGLGALSLLRRRKA